MKQFDTKDVNVSGHQFHIRPFPAFKAANLSGELAQLAIPLLGAITALPGGSGENPLDRDFSEIATALSGAFDSLSGDKVENLLKKLLTQSGNIAIDLEDGSATVLTDDYVNEIFCCDILGIYQLAFEVIRFNFGGFFKKLGNLSGSVTEKVAPLMKKAASTDTDTSI